MGRLSDRVALITGAGRGIGAATARRFAAEGASLVLNDIDAGPLEEVAGRLRDAGCPVVTNTGNTVSREAADRLVAAAVEEFGKLDILVNNAGITRDKMFHTMADDQWEFVLDVNLRTAYNNTKAAVSHMRETAKSELETSGSPAYHRKITFTSSTSGLLGNAGQANYASAKMALVGLARTLCLELGRFHINVNVVAPGFIETRLTAAKEQSPGAELGMPEALRNMALMMIPMQRFGQPEDVANAHVFLASSESDYVTGQVLIISGGLARS